MPSERQKIGSKAEMMARKHLEEKGYLFRDAHWTCRYGELDLVMEKDGELVFVEVKMRSRHDYGFPEESVGRQKQRKLMRSAECYLGQKKLYEQFWRFDIIALSEAGNTPEILHFTDVFSS